jgi:uncharacterized Fe-S cluster-containing protein
MKLEVGSLIITEFCGLSPKSHCYKYCEKEIKKANEAFTLLKNKYVPVLNKIGPKP